MKKNTTLQATRIACGKTQSQVAKEVGIFQQAYQRYEYGAGSQIIQTAIKIAKAVGSTVEELWKVPQSNYNTKQDFKTTKKLYSNI